MQLFNSNEWSILCVRLPAAEIRQLEIHVDTRYTVLYATYFRETPHSISGIRMGTTYQLHHEPELTPEILGLFPDTNITDGTVSFSASVSVLSSVCPNLWPVLTSVQASTESVIIFSGFDGGFLSALDQLTKYGQIQFFAKDEQQLQEIIAILRSDLEFLGTQLPPNFWNTQTKLEQDAIDESNSFPCIKEEYSEPSGDEFSPTLKEDLSNKDHQHDNEDEREKIWVNNLESVVFEGTSEITKKVKTFYRCCFCDTILTKGFNWKLHIKSKHKEKLKLIRGPFKCQSCSRNFLTIGTYCRHLNSKCCTGRPVMCDICGKSFKSEGEVEFHHKMTHASDNMKCDHCGKVYKNEFRLKTHIKRSHLKVLQCDQCPKTFNNNNKLKLHKLRMHTSNDDKPFLCKLCGKGFATGGALKDHMNSHTREVLFRCRICEYSSPSIGNRNKHERQTHKYFCESKSNEPSLD